MKRKTIALITANPNSIYSQRIMKGVFLQCEKYGYNVAVFSPMVQVCHYFKNYLKGELNIYELINFELIDGVIVDSISLTEDNVKWVTEKLLTKFRNECSKPVVSIDLPFGGYDVLETDDTSAFEKITEHVLDVHKCEKIYFLAGLREHNVSKKRLRGFLNVMEKRRIKIDEGCIFYGDFWYGSGELLADRIAGNELDIPDAVICASDHMAIGLVCRLMKHGIKVPEQVIVTGYDATFEAALNEPAITTYVPDMSKTAAEAVNRLCAAIEPERDIEPLAETAVGGLAVCGSCGCAEDKLYIKNNFSDLYIRSNQNYNDKGIFDNVDLGMYQNTYMFEGLTGTHTVSECLYSIMWHCYLIKPFINFYLCLCPDWLENDENPSEGYPDRMRNVIHAVPDNDNDEERIKQHCDNSPPDHDFDTALMLPHMWEEREKPSVFYFVPVHFQERTFGYVVLECSLEQKQKLGVVFHNWLRSVNSALEMKRTQNKLTAYAECDSMTGLMNRLGMRNRLDEKEKTAEKDDTALVFVIDMDGLKYINDTFGHAEGDFGIRTVSSAVRNVTKSDEICVRTGGDEFCIIGIGKYLPDEADQRIKKFTAALEAMNATADKPYEISASIGCASAPYSENIVNKLIEAADEKMYKDKNQRKKQRK